MQKDKKEKIETIKRVSSGYSEFPRVLNKRREIKLIILTDIRFQLG